MFSQGKFFSMTILLYSPPSRVKGATQAGVVNKPQDL
jgi:hypothetical protein